MMKTMTKDELRALRVKVRSTYIDSPMDPIVYEAAAYFEENIGDFESGAASPRRAYFVTGPAGTGKSSAIKHALSKIHEFQPYYDKYGERVCPYVYVKLPKECKTLDLVVAILKAMGLPHEGREKDLTDELLSQLMKRQTKILHLDELQHTVRSNTRAAFEAAQDLIKQFVDRDDWPLHAFLSGMPRIENIRQDDQIGRRSKVISFHRMDFEADGKRLINLLDQIAVAACGLKLDEYLQTEEFLERLCHAYRGAWGTTIEAIQSAGFVALKKGKNVLTRNHFAQEYESDSGALREENIFISPRFREIEPKSSLASMMED